MPVELTPLPFPLDALEPHMSKKTFEYHWGKHHRAYVDNLNNQIKETDLAEAPLVEIIKKSWNNGSPAPCFNNAAQVWNHTFFWESMTPGGGGKPTGDLAAAIDKSFGSYEEFALQFKTAGATQFGSGWAWLITDEAGKLTVTKTPNADTPIAMGQTPILTMDVWEHAYYLDYQNKRPDYIGVFLEHLVNWPKVAERYAEAVLST